MTAIPVSMALEIAVATLPGRKAAIQTTLLDPFVIGRDLHPTSSAFLPRSVDHRRRSSPAPRAQTASDCRKRRPTTPADAAHLLPDAVHSVGWHIAELGVLAADEDPGTDELEHLHLRRHLEGQIDLGGVVRLGAD